MAWNFYLNLESIALKSARDAADMMTEDNRYPDPSDYYDTEAFTNNLQHGFVALVMVLSYLECVVNSALRDCFGYSPDGNLMHSSLEAKLEVLMCNHQEEYRRIRSHVSWKAFCSAKTVRNALVHYKKNKAGTMSSAAPLGTWKIGNQILGTFFTRASIVNCIEDVVLLSEEVVHALGLDLAKSFPAIITDASGVPISYVYDPSEYDSESIAMFERAMGCAEGES